MNLGAAEAAALAAIVFARRVPIVWVCSVELPPR
jgi:hypothetical protein